MDTPHRKRSAFEWIATLAVLALVTCFAVPGLAADDPSKTVEEHRTDDASAARDGEAWAEFRTASLQAGRGEHARSLQTLAELRRDHPEHASAVLARPVLETYRDRAAVDAGHIPTESELTPRSEHPAVGDETSAVHDPAWAAYREAFERLAARDAETARSRLVALIDAHPDHPAAASATELEQVIAERLDAERERRAALRASRTSDTSEISPGGALRPFQPAHLRVPAEMGGASLGAALGIAGGGLLGGATGAVFIDGGYRGLGTLVFGGFGAYIGGLGGIPAGVQYAGDAAGGTGNPFATFLGAGAGLAVDIGVTRIRAGRFSGLGLRQLSRRAGLTLIGAVVGYELSNDRTPPSAESNGPFRVHPVATPTSGGGILGVDVDF